MSSVIVTGGSSGIGAATCRRFATLGDDLVIHAGHRREAAQAVATECARHGVRTRVVVGELADPSTTSRLFEAAADLGPLRVIVANAGFSDRTSLMELDDTRLRHSLESMVVALGRLLRAGLPRLAENDGGRFIAVSSFVASRFQLSTSTFAATAAAKAGVEALVRAAAMEAAAGGVTVNAVAPGYVRKDDPNASALDPAQLQAMLERVPLKRICTPDDIAGAIIFLAGSDAGMITGQLLRVDGGLTL